ncbi:MAG: DUF2946 family protein [Giesbergeria sp.]
MTAPRPSPRRFRAASLLALLAVLAQLWMVQLSHQHMAQQASSWLQWGEICSIQNANATESGNSDAPIGMAGMGCPVCVVAGLGLAPIPLNQVAVALPTTVDAPPTWRNAARAQQRERSMRPPAQAPPTALS